MNNDYYNATEQYSCSCNDCCCYGYCYDVLGLLIRNFDEINQVHFSKPTRKKNEPITLLLSFSLPSPLTLSS